MSNSLEVRREENSAGESLGKAASYWWVSHFWLILRFPLLMKMAISYVFILGGLERHQKTYPQDWPILSKWPSDDSSIDIWIGLCRYASECWGRVWCGREMVGNSEMVLIKKNNSTVPSSTLQYMFVQGTCMQNKPVLSGMFDVCLHILHRYDHHGTTERDACGSRFRQVSDLLREGQVVGQHREGRYSAVRATDRVGHRYVLDGQLGNRGFQISHHNSIIVKIVEYGSESEAYYFSRSHSFCRLQLVFREIPRNMHDIIIQPHYPIDVYAVLRSCQARRVAY